MSFRRSVAWMAASQGCLFVLQFGGSVALARLLTPYEMGVFAVAAAVMGVLGILQAFGLAVFVVREPQIDADLLERLHSQLDPCGARSVSRCGLQRGCRHIFA